MKQNKSPWNMERLTNDQLLARYAQQERKLLAARRKAAQRGEAWRVAKIDGALLDVKIGRAALVNA